MRRKNNQTEDVTLFVGTCKLITLNSSRQTVYAARTIRLNQKVIYTYKNPLFIVHNSQMESSPKNKNPIILLQGLTTHEYQYKITPNIRPKLILYERDTQIESFLNGLKLTTSGNDKNSIVTILHQEQGFFNGFVFARQSDALDFYEAINVAISTQMYKSALSSKQSSFNYRICNMFADTLNGSCVIDPMDFLDGKQEEEEIQLVIKLLNSIKKEAPHNFRKNLFEITLKFRIVDEPSQKYAGKFITSLQDKIERLNLNECQLTSNIMSQMMILPPYNLAENLKYLQQLNLSKNNLTDDVFATISNMLQHSKKLHIFNLSQNEITLEKESMLLAFLTSISIYKINLNLAGNRIRTAKYIIKYIINSDGTIPLAKLDLSRNPFTSEDSNAIAKYYLENCKQQKSDFKLQLNELQFQEPYAFQFLAEEYWFKRQKTMSIPISISKHPIRKKGQKISNSSEEMDKFQTIEELYKSYGSQIFKGNFYEMKKIKYKLLQMGAEEEDIVAKVSHCYPYRQQQENMIIKKLQTCLNFETDPNTIIQDLNDGIRYARRKGLTGQAINCIAFIKHRIQQLTDQWNKNNQLGKCYNQVFYQHKHRYNNIYQNKLEQNSIINIDYQQVITSTDEQLLNLQNDKKHSQNIQLYLIYHYLTFQTKPKIDRWLIDTCLTDPRLASVKVVRFQKYNVVQFEQTFRVPRCTAVNISEISNSINLGLQTYSFSKQFLESGASASAYPSMLSPHKPDFQHSKLISAFIQVCNNLLSFLYYTPNQLSDEALKYTSYICDYLMSLQNAEERDLKNLLAEQLVIHFLTYFDSQKHQPLKKGLIALLFQFFTKRISFDSQLMDRLSAYLVKIDSLPEDGLKLHVTKDELGETKINWVVKQIPILREIILKRGTIQIEIADIMHHELSITLNVDELDTILDIWKQVKFNLVKISELTTVEAKNIDYYWLCGKNISSELPYLKLLASHEHIGKIIFGDQMEKKLYLRKVISPPELHSLNYLKQINYEELIQIYAQARQSFKESAQFLSHDKNQEFISNTIILEIWIDSLMMEEIMLANLRKQQDEESKLKYKSQRQKIHNECMSKLYEKYVPLGLTLDDPSRLAIITQIKSKEQGAISKNIAEQVRQSIDKYMQNLGIIAYSIVIPDQTDSNLLFINNHNFVFVDRSSGKPRVIRCKFKHLLWFQLVGGVNPQMNFDVIEDIKNGQIHLYKFSIYGDHLWLSQCFLMITQICLMRLSYPIQLIFNNQDSINGLSCLPYKYQRVSSNHLPILDLSKYFKFNLPRKHNGATGPIKNVVVPKPQRKSQKFVIGEGKLQKSIIIQKPDNSRRSIKADVVEKQIDHNVRSIIVDPPENKLDQSQVQQKSENNNQTILKSVIYQEPQRVSIPKSNQGQKTIEIQDVVGAVEKEDDDQVVVKRRNTGKRQSRRNSRNR